MSECAFCGDVSDPEADDCETCGKRLKPAKRRGLVRKRLNGQIRERYGVIVTFETDDGPLTLHAPGKPYQAVRDAIERAERITSEPRVVNVSTPETIMGDLAGRLNPQQHRMGDGITVGFLSSAKRLDYLAPHLAQRRLLRSDRAQTNRRNRSTAA